MKITQSAFVFGIVIGITLPIARPNAAAAVQLKPASARQAGSENAKPKDPEPVTYEVLRGKAKALILQSRSPANVPQKDDLLKQARAQLAEARGLLQADHDRHRKSYEAFDKFIDKSDKARYDARELAYREYIQAQLLLAVLTYDEAQTYDKGSAENKRLLTAAADAFEKIHARYRQMVAGLYARMWQGKCFEEQEDIVKALGIYNELLQHEGNSSPVLKTLQDQVRLFRLICLNHVERQDFRLVIDAAGEWLEANAELASSRTGLGIQWELVRALESQAKQERTSPTERRALRMQALEVARSINQFPGEYKDVSAAAIERLTDDLKQE